MRNIRWVAVACVAWVFWSGVSHAQDGVPLDEAEGGQLWFVELAGAPLAEGNTLAALQLEKAAFKRAALDAGVRFTERRSFDSLFNGFSVEVNPAERVKLARLSGLKAMYPVHLIQAPPVDSDTAEWVAEMTTALAMTGADIAQNTLGLTGAGVRVGVVDSGIDIDHPAFGGTGVPGTTLFPSERIAYGWDFVGDAYQPQPGTGYNPIPAPDAVPDDCFGHGTHVAGIVGAGGAVKGVATGVTFGAYRVFGCSGVTTDDVLLAALERALADDMHVVNMSVGAPFLWPQSPVARAASHLARKGVVMVAAMGNNGSSGLYAAVDPGVGDKVIAVASYENTHLRQRDFTFTITPDDKVISFFPSSDTPLPPLVRTTFPMARTGTAASTNDACNAVAPPLGSLTGAVALIRGGTCTSYEKARNAQAAGAVGVALYATGIFGLRGTPPLTIPAVILTTPDGLIIDSRLASGPVTMTFPDPRIVPNPTAGRISTLSSYGPAPDLSLKPDLGAPGGMIFSTFPLEKGGFASNTGTSMASAYVSGAAALVLQARPRIRPGAMRTLLQNSADPRNWGPNPSLGLLDNVHRQGAGMLDIPGAVQATTMIEPSALALGESAGGPVTRTLTLSNTGASAVSYAVSHVAALATGPNTFIVSSFDAPASVSFSAANVLVPAGGSASVDVTIAAPGDAMLADRGLYGGYLVFTPASGPAYRVPYTGFKGDYQSITVLTPTFRGLPWLAKSSGTLFFNQPAGATYTMAGSDIPYFVLHLDHQSQLLRLEAFEAASGRSWHRVSNDKHVARSSGVNAFFALAWDGNTFTGKGKNDNQWRTVPNGQYVVKVSVLRALGDEDNPSHWETWTSPVITIARP